MTSAYKKRKIKNIMRRVGNKMPTYKQRLVGKVQSAMMAGLTMPKWDNAISDKKKCQMMDEILRQHVEEKNAKAR